jgi:hypothetical protein
MAAAKPLLNKHLIGDAEMNFGLQLEGLRSRIQTAGGGRGSRVFYTDLSLSSLRHWFTQDHDRPLTSIQSSDHWKRKVLFEIDKEEIK